ncbi:MAG: hypothetical protein KDJ38_02325 [Gammaproteobacteria bacterium]|nr:hypothetical protein [Gammaproteobacteria bacterium]
MLSRSKNNRSKQRPSKSRRAGVRRRSPSRSSRRNHQSWPLLTAFILMLATTLGSAYWFVGNAANQVSMNMKTFCYEDIPDQYQTGFFIDYSVTEFASPEQIRDLRNSLENAFEASEAGGRVNWFSTASGISSSVVKPFFTMCRPAKTPLESQRVGLPEKTLAQHKYQYDQAKKTYMEAVDTLIAERAEKSSKESPILEQIQGIGGYYLRQKQQLNHFYVYTDGIQNSEIAQFCQTRNHLPPFPLFKKTRTYDLVKPEGFEQTKVDFLLVELLSLPSAGLEYCTNDELRDFWPAFFEDAGAEVVAPAKRLRYTIDQTAQSGAGDDTEEPYICSHCHTDMG